MHLLLPPQVASNENGGPGDGSRIAFPAWADVSYYVVLEPDYGSSDCETVGIDFSAVELPGIVAHLLVCFRLA